MKMILVLILLIVLLYVDWLVVQTLVLIIDPAWANGIGILLGFMILFSMVELVGGGKHG